MADVEEVEYCELKGLRCWKPRGRHAHDDGSRRDALNTYNNVGEHVKQLSNQKSRKLEQHQY